MRLLGNLSVGAAGMVLAAGAAWAQAPAQPAQPLWELGVFGLGVSQQAYPGSDTQVRRGLALPYLVYRGRFLRADGDTAGLRAIKTPRFELDIGVAGAFGSASRDVDARRGMPDLGTLVEFGPRLKWHLGEAPGGGRWRLDLPLRGVFDLSDGAAHRGMAFEPELQFQRRTRGGLAYSASVGAILADRRLADTFYTVAPAFAAPGRPAYAARSGLLAWRLGASASYGLTPDLRLFGFGRIDSVAGGANDDSPLVRRTTGATVGVGLAYTWMRSSRSASD